MKQSVFVPEHLSARVALLPEHRIGIHRVTVELLDGKTFSPVLIAWETEIVRVEGSDDIPFAEADIVDLYDASPP